MSTQLFFHYQTPTNGAKIQNGQSYLSLLNTNLTWDNGRYLDGSRGAGIDPTGSWSTVTGPTNGIEFNNGSSAVLTFFTNPLSAAATISGTITCNIWASESSMSANAAVNLRFWKWDAETGNVTEFAKTARTTELGTSSAVNNFTVSPTSTSFAIGDRIVVVPFMDDSTSSMATGFLTFISVGGTTAAADGDSYVTFTENLTFFSSAPAGTTIYPTTTAASNSLDVSASAPSLLTAFTTANENPISLGGTWSNLNTALSGAIQITSNAAAPTSGVNDGWSYYNVQNYGPDVQVYLTISTASSGSAKLAARIQGEGGSNTWDGYAASANAGNQNWVLSRVDNGVLTTLLSSPASSFTWVSGDKVGLSCIGNQISIWYFANGGSVWTRLGAVIDTTYSSAGKVGIGGGSNTGLRMDDYNVGQSAWEFAFGNGSAKEAWTSRGGSSTNAVTNTAVVGVAPIQVTDTGGGTNLEWYTRPLAAFTLSGPVLVNHRVKESNVSANLTYLCEIAITAGDGTGASIWGFGGWGSGNVGEPTTTDAAGVYWITGPDTAVTDGQRIRIRWYIDDSRYASSDGMASGFTGTLSYNGASGGAAGDTFLTFTNTLTELTSKSPPFRHNKRCMIVR